MAIAISIFTPATAVPCCACYPNSNRWSAVEPISRDAENGNCENRMLENSVDAVSDLA